MAVAEAGVAPASTGARGVSIRHWPPLIALAAAAGAQLYAGFGLLALYGDGAYCLRVLLSGRRFSCIEAPRRAIQTLQETPAVLGVRLGLTDLDVIERMFSLTLQLMPLIVTGLAVAVVWRHYRSFILFPILDYFAGSSSVASNQMLEAPTASAWFWLLLFLILFRSTGTARRAALAIVALPAMMSHEVMIFLAPVLACAAWLRSRDDDGPGRWFMWSVCAWFILVAGVEFHYVIHPVHPANRDGFISQMLAFKWLYASGYGVNVPALLGLLAIGAIAIGWIAPRLANFGVAVFLLAAVAGSGAALVSGAARAPIMQFFARDHPAFIALLLAPAALWLWRRPARWSAVPMRSANAVILILALATCGVQGATTADWRAYVARYRMVLTEISGVVPWETVVGRLSADDRRRFARMDWGWTHPDLSLLLARDGVVKGIVANPVDRVWQPWDPNVLSDYPSGPFWRIEANGR